VPISKHGDFQKLTISVRTTRARIIYLRNDYKELMGVIEKHLHEHFASLEDGDEVPPPSFDASELRDSIPEHLDPPFAKVNSVVENSPAETAGLRAGDLIRNFGYVNRENHDNLKKVAECVQGNEGVRLLWLRQQLPAAKA
jgi:26S proteasome non-ATPase regulatory subunit 9